MRIAIDIDSTLHHYWDQLAEVAKRRFGVDLPYESQEVWHIAQLRPEQARACVEETHRARYVLAAAPYPGAVEAIARWHAAGHFIHVTSHRAPEAHEHTAQWLERIGLPHHELHCSHDKIARCREIGIDLLIDDAPRTLEQALEAGMLAATIAHPWNRELRETEDVIHGRDWNELAQRLESVVGARLGGELAVDGRPAGTIRADRAP